MQTFLPYPDVEQSVKCLDNKRLGKQRVEAKQIIQTILENKKSWSNHPAITMWRDNVTCLKFYFNHCLQEFEARGFKNIILTEYCLDKEVVYPYWWNDPRFHDSHKSNLLRKYPEHYSKFGWSVPPNLEYYWPVRVK